MWLLLIARMAVSIFVSSSNTKLWTLSSPTPTSLCLQICRKLILTRLVGSRVTFLSFAKHVSISPPYRIPRTQHFIGLGPNPFVRMVRPYPSLSQTIFYTPSSPSRNTVAPAALAHAPSPSFAGTQAKMVASKQPSSAKPAPKSKMSVKPAC